ncbi:MAG: alginate biosynthesis protein AlgK [Pseudomonas sp.]|uniref:SEL1-like repeat protein n=1 Tax=Pseudomonas sp. TaxID=306 RepID=UPI002733F02B|nr:alginate biosynthesis protein AlgK [Pseudomonas sp.]MDP3845021.1 alginate biosynthesis protein AlgK [Pseudomonas sp.]
MNKSFSLAGGLLGAIGLSLLSGCTALPDLQLARQAKAQGDLATAEENFRPLAEQGYVDAQMGMADLLVRSPLPAQQAQAEGYYRQALGRSPAAAVGLGKWLASKPAPSAVERKEAEQLLRQGLAAGNRTTLIPLTALLVRDPQRIASGEIAQQLGQWQAAGMGEAQYGKVMLYRARGDYNQHLVEVEQTCEQWLATISECYAELAALYQGRGDAAKQQQLLERLLGSYQAGVLPAASVLPVAKLLGNNANGQADPSAAKRLLTAITGSYPDAWFSLAALLKTYPEQGGTDEMLGALQQGIAAGSARSALMLGQLYLVDQYVPVNFQTAEKYLLQALPAEPKAHLLLGKLYSEGQLGEIDPDKALVHFLAAARAGDPNADLALAQLFGDGQGIKINPIYAYSFAKLALHQGLPQGQVLMERIAPRLQPHDYPKVESLFSQELQARSGPQLTVHHQADQMQGML